MDCLSMLLISSIFLKHKSQKSFYLHKYNNPPLKLFRPDLNLSNISISMGTNGNTCATRCIKYVIRTKVPDNFFLPHDQ